jgi:hypothetical protein
MVNPRSLSPKPRSRLVTARWLCAGLCRIALPAALVLLFLSPGLAQEKAPADAGLKSSWGAETFFYSRYVSKGIASSDGPVLQPSAWVTLDDFTLTYFGNLVLNREERQGRFNEADISLAWTREWKGFSIEPIFTLHTYPNTEDQSQYETGLTLARDLGPWRLSTFNSVTFAVSEKATYFGEIALGYQQDLLERLSFTAELSLSCPTPAATLEGKLAYDLTGNWALYVHAGCSITRSDAASDDNHDSKTQDTLPQGRNGFIGLGLGLKF